MFALIIQQGYYEDQMRSSISKRLKGLTTVAVVCCYHISPERSLQNEAQIAA